MMSRVRLHLSYDGTDYKGWQKQSGQKDIQTIQGQLEKALKKLTAFDISTTGSGRTDAGVHAQKQVVHFDLPPEKSFETTDWRRGLNCFLPGAIRVQEAHLAPPQFHALKSALSKTYLYRLHDSPAEDPLRSRQSWWVSSPLDLDYLQKLSRPLVGRHDFASFQTSGTILATTTREILSFQWSREADGSVCAQIEGSGFLKQMVRNLIGTLTHRYWLKELKPQHILEILEAKDRQKAFGTAPAHGLCLLDVKYPAELDKNLPKS